jgi:two-component system nitrogen regulation sensor histidine kinase GlnL
MKLAPAAARAAPLHSPEVDEIAILNAIDVAVIVIDSDNRLRYANATAEQFFDASALQLLGAALETHIPADSPLFSLIKQARDEGIGVSEYGVSLSTPRLGPRIVTFQVTPLIETPGSIIVSLHERSDALKIDRQLTHRNAARSVTAMASMLAHEVKNPLSGIRGAAQLLEQTSSPEDRQLTRLICEETDRICALLDRMDMFSDKTPFERQAVNIHLVLQRVRAIAENGFGRHVRFRETYDPSLPPVFGNRDQLVQVFLNLLKNAAEAAPARGADIHISTAYQHGMRLAVPGAGSRLDLPLVVTIQDNGKGIPEDLRPHLFDPFVTTKAGGSGLGLALVAKIIGDHGGVVEFDGEPRRTRFHVRLPVVSTPSNTGGEKTVSVVEGT